MQEAWKSIDTAPKDGTVIELLIRHSNFQYCKTERERTDWEQIVRAHWIEFNGGGWTWHGMYGTPFFWRTPALAAATRNATDKF